MSFLRNTLLCPGAKAAKAPFLLLPCRDREARHTHSSPGWFLTLSRSQPQQEPAEGTALKPWYFKSDGIFQAAVSGVNRKIKPKLVSSLPAALTGKDIQPWWKRDKKQNKGKNPIQ